MLVFGERRKLEYPGKNQTVNQEIEPGPYWWKASAFTTAPSQLCPVCHTILSPQVHGGRKTLWQFIGVCKKGAHGDTSKALSKLILNFVYIHLQLGPNVSVGSNVVIGAGARVRETILLDGAELKVIRSSRRYDGCCNENLTLNFEVL